MQCPLLAFSLHSDSKMGIELKFGFMLPAVLALWATAEFLTTQCECEGRELEDVCKEMKGKVCAGNCEENGSGLDFCFRNAQNFLSFSIRQRKK